MKTVLSDVRNYSNNKIIMFLYRKGIFFIGRIIFISQNP